MNWKWWTRWLPRIFGIFIIITTGIEFSYCYQVSVTIQQNGAGKQVIDIAQLDRYIQDIRWLLGVVVSATALFTMAQGTATYYSGQNFLKKFEKTEEDIRKQFPFYATYENLLKQALKELSTLSWIDEASKSQEGHKHELFWNRQLYEKLSLTKRQQLIMFNHIFPTVLQSNFQSFLDIVHVRNLALFYWAKFIYEKERGFAYLGDLEYAEYLIDQAIQNAGSKFFLLNDKGNIGIENYQAIRSARSVNEVTREKETPLMMTIRQNARYLFQTSIGLEKKQLRAYYNLAYLEADLINGDTDLKKQRWYAINYLLEGLKYPNWERTEIPEFSCNAHYNLACYLSRALNDDLELCSDNAQLTSYGGIRAYCVKELRQAAVIGLIPAKTVEQDFRIGGDFAKLLNSQPEPYDPNWQRLQSELSQQLLS